MALLKSWRSSTHLHHERLPARHVKGVDQTLKGTQYQNLPYGDLLRERQAGQHQGLHGRQCLSPKQYVPAVQPVDPYARKGSQQESGNLSHKANPPQQKGRSRKPVNQPKGGHAGHPGTDNRNALAAEKQPEVAVPQGTPCMGETTACSDDPVPLLLLT